MHTAPLKVGTVAIIVVVCCRERSHQLNVGEVCIGIGGGLPLVYQQGVIQRALQNYVFSLRCSLRALSRPVIFSIKENMIHDALI
jgi:hypothetical protein